MASNTKETKKNVTGLDQGTGYYYTYYLSQGSRKMTTPVNKVITLSPYTAALASLIRRTGIPEASEIMETMGVFR